MRGVSFDGKHTYTDFKLITNKITVGYPAVKTNYVEVPGRDGSLDLTEAFGEVRYEDRQLEFKFTALNIGEEEKGKIVGFLTGGRKKIILDKDERYFYSGRCALKSVDCKGALTELSLTALCDPYKYHLRETYHKECVKGSNDFILSNDRKPVVPVIECDSPMKILFENLAIELAAGKHKILDLRLKEGYNRITVIGRGNISFVYREGAI